MRLCVFVCRYDVSLHRQPDSLDELKGVLATVATIRNEGMLMELRYADLEERYRTRVLYATTPQEETLCAEELADAQQVPGWRGMHTHTHTHRFGHRQTHDARTHIATLFTPVSQCCVTRGRRSLRCALFMNMYVCVCACVCLTVASHVAGAC